VNVFKGDILHALHPETAPMRTI